MNEAYGDHVVNARRMGWSAPTSVGCMGRRPSPWLASLGSAKADQVGALRTESRPATDRGGRLTAWPPARFWRKRSRPPVTMGRHARVIPAYRLDGDPGAMRSHQHEAHRLAHDANRFADWRTKESLDLAQSS